jgi:hypothetical protein
MLMLTVIPYFQLYFKPLFFPRMLFDILKIHQSKTLPNYQPEREKKSDNTVSAFLTDILFIQGIDFNEKTKA